MAQWGVKGACGRLLRNLLDSETLSVGRPRRPAKKAALGNLMWY